jgi:hypothetical protein
MPPYAIPSLEISCKNDPGIWPQYGAAGAQMASAARPNSPFAAGRIGQFCTAEIGPFWLTFRRGEAYIAVPARRPLYGAIARL